MEDERNTPQDEEVEAHSHARPAPMEEPSHAARDEDDEVEAHSRARPAPAESKVPKPEE